MALLASALVGPVSAQELDDPWEGYNRAIFGFNDTVDVYFFEPVAKGYDYVVPNPVQDSVDNFFINLRTPIYLVSDLVQLKFGQFGTHTARFAINTTLGVVGLFDVAKSLDFIHQPADFGIALGHNGVPSGPYFVLPLLGPSTVRDAFGRLVDSFLNPTFYVTELDISGRDAFYVSAGLYLVDSINTRASLLDAVETAKEASLDYYGFVRGAYGQFRSRQIKGLPTATPLDEYNFDDEDFSGGTGDASGGTGDASGGTGDASGGTGDASGGIGAAGAQTDEAPKPSADENTSSTAQ